MWRTLHHIALGFPAPNPSGSGANDYDKAMYRNFFVSLGHVIPCPTCAEILRRHSAASLDAALDSGNLFDWTVELHNAVNRELGASDDWTPARALTALAGPLQSRPVPMPMPPFDIMAPALAVGFIVAAVFFYILLCIPLTGAVKSAMTLLWRRSIV